MRRTLPAAALAAALSTVLAAAVRADSGAAGLRIGVEVNRQCAVTTGATVEVRCTRTAGAAVQATVDGRVAAPTPLTVSGPGSVSASIPLGSGASTPSVVTVLF